MEDREGHLIPVFINVFNRLTTTRRLADQVACLPDAVPIIIDNASTWKPLMDWYEECPYKVVRLDKNLGHHSPWQCRVIDDVDEKFYCVTDCDLDIGDCPADLLDLLQIPLKSKSVIKSGLGLRIDDLPEWQSDVVKWESRWWQNPSHDERFFIAAVDTTFAMYRTGTPHSDAMFVSGSKATRTAPPYLARHMPWYLDANNLDDENANYFRTANGSNSWKPDGRSLKASYS